MNETKKTSRADFTKKDLTQCVKSRCFLNTKSFYHGFIENFGSPTHTHFIPLYACKYI